MRKQSFIILIALTALLAAIALFQGKLRLQKTEEASHKPLLYPELKDKLAEVTTLQIFKKKGVANVTLVKNNEAWVVQEKDQYPADIQKINRLLFALSEAEILEEKTSRVENYAKLGVSGLTDEKESEKSIQLKMLGQNNGELVSLLVGETRLGSTGGTYVRKPDEEKSWLVSGELTVPSEATAWLNKQVIHVRPDSVHKVVLTAQKGKPLMILKEKPEQPHFSVSPLPKKVKLAKVEEIDVVASGLSHLYLDDVLPKASVDWKKQSQVMNVEYHLFDGLIVQGKLAKINDKNVLELQASVQPSILKEENKETKPVASTETEEPATARRIDQFKSRLESYAYVIPNYSADLMRKRLEDFIDKTPQDTPEPSKKPPYPSSPKLQEKPEIETAVSKK